MENMWESRVQDSNFKAWFVNMLNEMKMEILEEVKQIITENAPPDVKKWIKSRQVKELFDISHGTLQSMRDSGTIPFAKIGGTIYYNLDDLDRMFRKKIANNDR